MSRSLVQSLLLSIVFAQAWALRTANSTESTAGGGNDVVLQMKLVPESAPTPVHIKLHPEWAPIGVKRFQSLVSSGFFNEAAVFRVVPGFIVQFGLPAKPQAEQANLQDDPSTVSNTRGTLVFATAGPGTRTSQMFINVGSNAGLDSQGFTPIGEVTMGMEVVDKINPQYGEAPDQGMVTSQGNAYLDANFPRLTKITSASLA